MPESRYKRKPDSHFMCIEFHGETRRFSDIAREYDIDYNVMLARYKHGDREDRLVRPKQPHRCHQKDISYENEPVIDPYEEEELYSMYRRNWHSMPKPVQLNLIAGFSGMKICPYVRRLQASFKERFEREAKEWETQNTPSTLLTVNVQL